MKIQSIFNYQLTNLNKNISTKFTPIIGNSGRDIFVRNKVNFCANRDFGDKTELSYDDFIKKYHKAYDEKPLEETVYDVIKHNQEINRGKDKKVYVFSKMDEYLIAHLYRMPQEERRAPIKPYPINFPQYNFGQALAGNGHDLIIMKKLEGIPNSVDVNSLKYIRRNYKANPQIAYDYLSKIRLFRDFPQSSYDDFARQIKYLSDNGQLIDFINPNNLLIDTKNKKFHLIDLLSEETNDEIKKYAGDRSTLKPGVYDMINLLLDARHQKFYLEQLDTKEQKEVMDISSDVIKKCFKAALKTNLPESQNNIETVYDYFQSRMNVDLKRRYYEFLKLYKELSLK